jgi:hypothetical protein
MMWETCGAFPSGPYARHNFTVESMYRMRLRNNPTPMSVDACRGSSGQRVLAGKSGRSLAKIELHHASRPGDKGQERIRRCQTSSGLSTGEAKERTQPSRPSSYPAMIAWSLGARFPTLSDFSVMMPRLWNSQEAVQCLVIASLEGGLGPMNAVGYLLCG